MPSPAGAAGGRRRSPVAAAQVAALGGVDRSAVRHDTDGNARHGTHPRPRATCTSATPAPRCSRGCRRAAAGGRIALRIEDLDRDRCRPEWEAALARRLAWLGLDWDFEQQRQSERGAVYDEALERLARGRPRLRVLLHARRGRAAASAPHGPEGASTRAPAATCRRPSAARAGGRAAARRCGCGVEPRGARLRRPVHGRVERDVAAGGDFVVRRADGLHAYQLAVVVDDGGASASRTCCAATTCCRRRRASCCCSGCSACRRRSTRTCR